MRGSHRSRTAAAAVVLTVAGIVAGSADVVVAALPGQAGPGAQSSLAPCPERPMLDHLPLARSEFRALRPLGWMSAPIHVIPARFSSFSRSLPGEVRPSARVESPGRVTVTGVILTEFPGTGGHGYQVQFSPCRELRFQMNHLGSLDAPLLAAVHAAPKTNCRTFDSGQGNVARTCQANVSVPLRSGALIGLSDEFAGVDFVAIDYRAPKAAFANPASYQGDFFYYVSPVPYFKTAPRRVLESMLGSYDGTVRRTAKPVTGTYMQDVPGTAQGNWYLPGQSPSRTESSDGSLALVHDYVVPTEPVVSVGTGVAGLAPGVYSFVPSASGSINREFRDVMPDGAVACYEAFRSGRTSGGIPLGSVHGVLLVRMPDREHLDLELRAASSCAATDRVIGPGATRYQR